MTPKIPGTPGDFYSYTVLIVIPVRLLWNMSLSVPERARVFLVFLASVLTTAASIAHAYYVFKELQTTLLLVCLIEVRRNVERIGVF